MSETVETETVYVKEECGAVDVKEEPAEEQDPLKLEKGNSCRFDIPYRKIVNSTCTLYTILVRIIETYIFKI